MSAKSGHALSRSFPAFVLGALATLALGCAGGMERVSSSGNSLIEFSCARWNPSMQTAVLEAVVAGGGPQSVDVAGWMCGRASFGDVRIVMLRYTPEDKTQPPFLVPVLFEEGAIVAFGWYLLEQQPERYGTSLLPDRGRPWRTPHGWSCRRYRGVADDLR